MDDLPPADSQQGEEGNSDYQREDLNGHAVRLSDHASPSGSAPIGMKSALQAEFKQS